MAENTQNLNIFEGAPGRFADALPLFAGVAGTALPVRREAAGAAQLYTLAETAADGRQALAAFTSAELLNPPLINRGLAETALLFFHAPHHDLFLFNPEHPQARYTCAGLRTSRLDMSLLAGYARSAGKAAQGDLARAADGELALGDLHGAHYLYAAAAARNPASRARFSMCAALIELGLLQEAYDLLKSDWDPEAKLLLAVIHRRTGNPAEARALLAALDQVAALQERREVEAAWLDLEEGKDAEAEKAFQKLSSAAFEKTEALSGLGAAISKTAFKTKEKGRLGAAAAALRSALVTPSPASARIFFQLGNLHFRSGEMPQAEAAYRRAAALTPSVQALANLALALIRTGKHEEAAAITSQVALTDLPSARRLAGQFPGDRLAALFREQPAAEPAAPRPQAAPPPPRQPAPRPAPAPQPEPPQVFQPAPVPAPEPRPTPGLEAAGAGFQFINPAEPMQAAAAHGEQLTLAPAQPRDASVSGRPRPVQPAPQPAAPQIETFRDVMAGSAPTEEESRKDDFISRAFRLASDLEDDLGRKIYFNLDGLNEVEKRLRLQFIKSRNNQQGNIETVRNGAAFLCYFLQERFKGRLIKFQDFDPWGWPMVFEQPGRKVSTYPVQRVWRLLWEETVPEPGWLTKYALWLADALKETAVPPCGAAAVKARVRSHPEKLADAMTEHRRMLVLLSSLNETSHIEFSRTGLARLEAAIKNNFRPNIPPTADGWKLLRCYGHLLAGILAKDFKAAWYNVDGEDGGWSMQLPWKTFVFPLGKIYKTASMRDDLGAYYEALVSDKLRLQGPTGS